MSTGQIVLVTDHGSEEDSRSCLAVAVERLTGRPPVMIDARHFMTGADGRVMTECDMLRRLMAPDDDVIAPSAVILYEIAPHERRRVEDLQRLLRKHRFRSLGTDTDAWRAATEKDVTVERFRRDGIPHMETVSFSRPGPEEVGDAFETLGRNVWSRPTVGMGGADIFHITDHGRLRDAARYYAASGQDWQLSRDADNVNRDGLRHQFRVTVLDGVVVQACENIQSDADKPCNMCRGAVSTVIDIDDVSADIQQLAVSATKSLGLRFGGVDLSMEHGGAVFEVNVHPGLYGPQRPMELAIPYVAAHLGLT